jgi:lipopolysaccharide/colanic/teichoic acid biosynthesis glycosyltransferase
MSTELRAPATSEKAADPIERLIRRLQEYTDFDSAIEPAHRGYAIFKPLVEYPFATLLALLAVPLVLLAAVLVKLTSRGPAFYSQSRVGKNGRCFTVFKLRTMVHKAEALTGAVWATPNDPRVTRVGRFLRITHVDELPQLANVLLGQMSLIGPRPERPEFVSHLEWKIPHYRGRLRVRPGMTGMAQLLLPADTDLDSVRRKLVYDLYYVRFQSVWLDLRIILFTAQYLIRTFFRCSLGSFSLPCPATLEQELADFANSTIGDGNAASAIIEPSNNQS